ncbi:unnamed protein product [Eruca vesicaria subsp. sativa]|uniref:Uncharacterized protein n=1 Tax=Eruca vesicaria subsp. sativa TaxID=29727 RepID=A0ABC8L284_ERUVS|nr:unnamed protein product [Eruca vesicaria subsp. sativa]
MSCRASNWISGECSTVIDKCLAQYNIKAHYIEGIMQFLYLDNPNDGLLHLHKSADGVYVSGSVIYGVLMLFLGHMYEGKKYLDFLEWKTNINRINKPWSRIKKSLRRVNIMLPKEHNETRVTGKLTCQ